MLIHTELQKDRRTLPGQDSLHGVTTLACVCDTVTKTGTVLPNAKCCLGAGDYFLVA